MAVGDIINLQYNLAVSAVQNFQPPAGVRWKAILFIADSANPSTVGLSYENKASSFIVDIGNTAAGAVIHLDNMLCDNVNFFTVINNSGTDTAYVCFLGVEVA